MPDLITPTTANNNVCDALKIARKAAWLWSDILKNSKLI
jgi:hypothetical protein